MVDSRIELINKVTNIEIAGGRVIICPELYTVKATTCQSDAIIIGVNGKASCLDLAVELFNAVKKCFREGANQVWIPYLGISLDISEFSVVEVDVTDDVYTEMLREYGVSLVKAVLYTKHTRLSKMSVTQYVDMSMWVEYKLLKDKGINQVSSKPVFKLTKGLTPSDTVKCQSIVVQTNETMSELVSRTKVALEAMYAGTINYLVYEPYNIIITLEGLDPTGRFISQLANDIVKALLLEMYSFVKEDNAGLLLEPVRFLETETEGVKVPFFFAKSTNGLAVSKQGAILLKRAFNAELCSGVILDSAYCSAKEKVISQLDFLSYDDQMFIIPEKQIGMFYKNEIKTIIDTKPLCVFKAIYSRELNIRELTIIGDSFFYIGYDNICYKAQGELEKALRQNQ